MVRLEGYVLVQIKVSSVVVNRLGALYLLRAQNASTVGR